MRTNTNEQKTQCVSSNATFKKINFFTSLIPDLNMQILGFLTPKEIASLAQTSKNWNKEMKACSSKYLLLSKGQKCLNEFLNRYSNLSKDDELYLRFNNLLEDRWSTHNCLLALGEGLIDANILEYDLRNRNGWLGFLLRDWSLQALRKGLVTIEEAKKLKHTLMSYLFSEVGIRALENKFITLDTAEQVIYNLGPLLTEEGYKTVFEDKLVPFEELNDLGNVKLRRLFSPEGRHALTHKLLTLQQAKDWNAVALGVFIDSMAKKLQQQESTISTPPQEPTTSSRLTR